MDSFNKEMILRTVGGLGFHQGQEVLELGQGYEGQLQELMEMAPHITYIGLSTFHPSVKKDRTDFGSNKSFQGSHDFLPSIEDNTFDRIVSVNSINFWKRPKELMGQLYRVLKDGGLLAIGFVQGRIMENLAVSAYGFEPYDIQKLVRLLRGFPFKAIDIANHTEKVQSTAGNGINREYTVLILEK